MFTALRFATTRLCKAQPLLLMMMLMMMHHPHGVCPFHIPMESEFLPVELHWEVPSGHHEQQQHEQHPMEATLNITAGNVTLSIILIKNRLLLPRYYTDTHYLESGDAVISPLNHSELCYYHGHVVGVKSSLVSLSTCHGVRAMIGLGDVDATFELLPLVGGGVVSGHVLLRRGGAPRWGQGSRVKRSPPVTCGVVDDPNGAERPRVAQSQGGNRRFLLTETKFVQLVLVADNAEFQKMGRDMGAVRSRLMEIANHVDRLYRQLRVRVLLVGVEVWTQGDRCQVSVDPSQTLAQFSEWRARDLGPRLGHNNAQLLTGVDFSGDTVGLAYVGTMCGSKSAGVNQDHSDSAVPIASTMAHEMGHNFGMSHDHAACECPAAASQGGCLLAPSLSSVSPRVFSSCSTASLNDFLAGTPPSGVGGGPCLDSPTDFSSIVGGPQCGNLLLEAGEECDCGGPQECTGHCCDALSCRLTPGSECAEGACCSISTCQLLSEGVLCREAVGPCDLPERCDGVKGRCPRDLHVMDGAGGRGCPEGHQCHGGTCPNTWGHQCQRLWGDGAGAAPASCFHGNQRGDVYGNCGRRGTTFIPCSREDSLCGKLPCVGGTRFPVSGSTLSVGSCRFAGISDSARSNSEDVSLVSDGTPCGQDKVCVGQRCVLVTSLGAEICSTTRCGGHGVCNNLGQCHCDLGWSPPHCDVKVAEPAGTVVTTVVVVVVVVVILLCLPLIFLALRRYRNSAARQNTYSQHLEEMQSIPDIQAKRPPPPPPAQTRDHLPLVMHAVIPSMHSSPQVRPKGAPPPVPRAALKPPAATASSLA